jgi:hypothetical protein
MLPAIHRKTTNFTGSDVWKFGSHQSTSILLSALDS